MEEKRKISETIRLGTLLAICGGFLDAYSYLVRGGVFANAVTGNIVLTGLNLAEGKYGRAVYCFIPVLSFATGVFAAEWIRERFDNKWHLHWKEWILWAELAVVMIAGFVPQEWNSIVNFSIAFVCAMQVEGFRKIRGKAYATTMCTGNLRSGTELLSVGLMEHDEEKKKLSLHYYWIDFVFGLSAVVGFYICKLFAEKAIWFCGIVLILAIVFLRVQRNQHYEV